MLLRSFASTPLAMIIDFGRWVRDRAINDGEWKKARRAKDGKRVERGW